MKRISLLIFAISLSLCTAGLTSCEWFNETHTRLEIVGGESWTGSTTVSLVNDEATRLTKLLTFNESGNQCRIITGIYVINGIDTEILNVKKEGDKIFLTHTESGKTLYTCLFNRDNEGKIETMTMKWSIHTDYERIIRDNPLTITLQKASN